ncbi:hypothetical protein HAX54_019394 [Datura stramonium]|uniref:Uncharacterized protein n=1 Tax=Datura stramonium TaxID=4076 RepID=A0ABS8UPU7_DATST|nr:hypothetical protein [Datura stramonium]
MRRRRPPLRRPGKNVGDATTRSCEKEGYSESESEKKLKIRVIGRGLTPIRPPINEFSIEASFGKVIVGRIEALDGGAAVDASFSPLILIALTFTWTLRNIYKGISRIGLILSLFIPLEEMKDPKELIFLFVVESLFD